MSLSTIQTPAGITFNEQKLSCTLLSGTTTIDVKRIVKIDNASLIAATPAVKVSFVKASDPAGGGLYGVVTKAVTSKSGGIIQLGGLATITSSAGVVIGPITTDAAGKIKDLGTATDGMVGVALETASGGDEDVQCLLMPGGMAIFDTTVDDA